MTKRRQPAKPRIIGESPFNLEALRLDANKDVKREQANRRHVDRARRLDVFQLFLDRGAVEPEHVGAVRILETDVHIAHGISGATEPREYVSGGGCAELVSQHMIEASRRVQAILDYMPTHHARLAEDLLSPIKQGNVITRWRDCVQRQTGITEKNAQGDVIRWFCAAVHEAVTDAAYATPSRRTA